MKRFAFTLFFCVLFASGVVAQTKSPVEGVWKIAERIMPGTQPLAKDETITNTRALPSLIIFTQGYFSQVYETGGQARPTVSPPKDRLNLTDAEKIARYEQWRPFNANAGSYEIKGSTITIRPIVAKNANLMGGSHVVEFKLEGTNTLWLIPIPEEAATEPRIKLTRLE